jgi:hypothetical protein
MCATLATNLVYENLSAAARYRIKSRSAEFAQHAFDAEPGDLRQMIKLGRREAVQMNSVSRLQLM